MHAPTFRYSINMTFEENLTLSLKDNMFDFFKNKKPVVTWWSSIKHLEKITPPVKADKYIPRWFKQVKKDTSKSHSNVKLCPSFFKIFFCRLGNTFVV